MLPRSFQNARILCDVGEVKYLVPLDDRIRMIEEVGSQKHDHNNMC